jgi:hypothetical protein
MKTFNKFINEMARPGAYTLPQAIQTMNVLADKLHEMDEVGFDGIADQFSDHISVLYRLISTAADQAFMKPHQSQ